MRIDVLENVARAAGFAGACDDDSQPDAVPAQSPDIPAPRVTQPARSTALAVIDARSVPQSVQSTATWLVAAPATVARSISSLLGRGAPA